MSTTTPVIGHDAKAARRKEIAERVKAYAFDERAWAIPQLAGQYGVDTRTAQNACREHGVEYPGAKWQKPAGRVPQEGGASRTNIPPRKRRGARA